jgi:3-oxoacyl-[acyl-carrier-protein] synthase III
MILKKYLMNRRLILLTNLNKGVGILGIGNSLPEKVMTNFDLEKMVDTSDEWITKRTGISERRILDEKTPIYSLGLKASKRALENAGVDAKALDLIIVATCTPDYLTPSTSCIIQKHLGADNAAAFDINAACSGFVYGMTVAQQFILTGYYKHVLVIGCEGLTKVTEWKDRNTCVLFGDGAGAVVLGEVDKGYGILSTDIGAVGELGHNLTIPCCHVEKEDIEKRKGDNNMVIWMDGSEVFKFAVRAMADSTKKVLDDAGISIDMVKLIVPHQANIRIIDGAAKRIGIKSDKIISMIHKYGNMSAASIPVVLDETYRNGSIEKGDYIVLVGFGGGLTWAAALIRWNI